jgi:hypothetical protein
MTYPPAEQQLQAVPEQLSPPQPQYPGEFGNEIAALCKAITAASQQAATSQDPEAVQRFLQGAFYGAQAIDKLTPQAPPELDPNAALKAQTEMDKHRTQLTHDATQQAAQREHDYRVAEMQAAKASAPQGKIGAKDG